MWLQIDQVCKKQKNNPKNLLWSMLKCIVKWMTCLSSSNKKMIMLFLNIFKAPYCEYLVSSLEQCCMDIVVVGERIEQAVKARRILNTIKANQKKGQIAGKRKTIKCTRWKAINFYVGVIGKIIRCPISKSIPLVTIFNHSL